MKAIIHFYLIFIIATSQSLSQEFWKTIAFPLEFETNLTCVAFDDDIIYAGTDTKGVFLTTDQGENWYSTSNIGTERVNQIVVGIDNIIWVQTGESNLFWTNRRGENWTDITFFRRRDYLISCLAVNQYGYIYVGTNQGIFKSTNLGNEWINITDNISVWTTHTIGINANDIFISIEGIATGFFFSDNEGTAWRAINNNLPRDPITKQFLFSIQGKIFANIQNDIYYTLNKGKLWSKFKEDLDPIDELLIDSKENLVAYDGNKIRLFSANKGDWLEDRDELKIGAVSQMKVKDDYLIAVKNKNILITEKKIEFIIAEFLLNWEITVVDYKNQPVRNKEFNLYKMYGTNQHGMGKITTDNYGKFTLSSKNFSIGNGVKIQRIVYTKPSVKSNHHDVSNTMYRIKTDNAKFDSLGAWQFDTLTSSASLTTRLEHTTVMFSLIFGVEWEAKSNYLDSLFEWLKQMNNYLYDVFDGQLYLEKVAIYDNQKYWKDVDFHIWTSNMVWPNAFLDGITVPKGKKAHLPRKWFGNQYASRKYSTNSYWLSIANNVFWTTIAHEFGHYAIGFDDEYMFTDTVKAKLLPKNYNYGYMNDQYPGHGEWSSELSNETRYPNDDFKITFQWETNKADCWNDFEKNFENIYDDIYCPIIKPSERINLGNRNFFIGPNDYSFSSVNSDVSYSLDCQIFDDYNNAGDFSIICKKFENNKYIILPETDIFLLKLNGYIYQGKTDDSAKCLLLGANIGDYGYATFSDYMNFTNYINKFPINSISSTKNNNDIIQRVSVPSEEDFDITLDKISGNFSFVSSIHYDNSGNLILNNYSSEIIDHLPVQFKDENEEFKVINSIMLNQYLWQANLGQNISESNFFRINLLDNKNQEFFIFLPYEISIAGKKIISRDGAMMLSLDEATNDFQKFAILSSDFLTSKNGLPAGSIQTSSIYSLSAYPLNAAIGRNFISVAYSELDLITGKEENLKLFKWNEDELKWEEMQNWVDTARNIVQAEFSQFGTYGLFIYEPTIDVNDDNEGSFDFEIIPDPTDGFAQIKIKLNAVENIDPLIIRIFDIFGNEKITSSAFLTRYNNDTYTSLLLDCSHLPTGVYICRIESGFGLATQKFIKW